jgi:hypothetical protein
MDTMKVAGSFERTRGVWLSFSAYYTTFYDMQNIYKGCQMLIFISVQVKNVMENTQNVQKKKEYCNVKSYSSFEVSFLQTT